MDMTAVAVYVWAKKIARNISEPLTVARRYHMDKSFSTAKILKKNEIAK
ncbi:MAG: hypothetical protein HDR49_00195 [Bacteroides sp.]|nr:hypothetical protein [Bacteroides sp.]